MSDQPTRPVRPELPPGLEVRRGVLGWHIFGPLVPARLFVDRPFDTRAEAVAEAWHLADSGAVLGMDWVRFADAETARVAGAGFICERVAALTADLAELTADLVEQVNDQQERIDDLVFIDVAAAELRAKKKGT